MQEVKSTLDKEDKAEITSGKAAKEDGNHDVTTMEGSPKQMNETPSTNGDGDAPNGTTSHEKDGTGSVVDEEQVSPDQSTAQAESKEPIPSPSKVVSMESKEPSEEGGDFEALMNCEDEEEERAPGDSGGQAENDVSTLKSQLQTFLEWCTLNGLAMSTKVRDFFSNCVPLIFDKVDF